MSMSLQHHVHEPPSRKNGKAASRDDFAPPPSLMSGRNQTVSPTNEGMPSPEGFTSIPNPFVPPMPNTVSASSMNSTNSGSPTHSPGGSAGLMATTGNPVVIAASGIRVPGAQTSPGGVSPSGSPGLSSSSPKDSGGGTNRRQKRLERNRESARLSRRRRKQYLEVLEERVNQLSYDMDKGRREHAAVAVSTLQEKRYFALQNHDLAALETTLSRTSSELRVAGTFQTQQLQSLVFSSHAKFLLWLSLQTDEYFRGGRAASERLSAARIGERMLGSGNDRVSPAHGMWPLLCNEVGLSYDQEEKVRAIQRTLVQAPETWLDRHTGAASGLVMQSTHDCMQALQHAIGQRERSIMSILNDDQRLKLLQWAASNQERLSRFKEGNGQQANDGFMLSPQNHDAANLYIFNHRLQNALHKVPTPPALVVRSSAKRLSRRPSFESLGSTGSLSERQQKEESRALSRESSFSSSGSLKRSASEMSLDDDRALPQAVSPEEAEIAAKPTVDAALGFVRSIMPLRPQPQPDTVSSFSLPPRAPKAGPPEQVPSQAPNHYQSQGQGMQQPTPQAVTSAPVAFNSMQRPHSMPSFLPLNSVPEEGDLAQQGSIDPADDFLFELAEEDWAIGHEFDMDTT